MDIIQTIEYQKRQIIFPINKFIDVYEARSNNILH